MQEWDGWDDPASPQAWSVFDRGGRFQGVVQLPPRLWVQDIGVDYVLGIGHDDLDVQSAVLYRLHK